ncbi:sporulation protein [Cohnella panacarvi]|uniref:sporulation protein n=1 Tax=Cohnella panacarvi TaxID=400776 RepID=UPI00047E07F8|nr:sporulation protein [Cohnella panacarvi]
MSMFKRMLANVGIGAARVDLILREQTVQAGNTISGVVRIQGGRVEQQVEVVYACVKTRYLKDVNHSKMYVDATIAAIPLAGKFTVEAEREYELPIAIRLPPYTPVTMGGTQVWIRTGMEINEAIDPKDEDYLQVTPHPYTAVVLEAAERAGFRLRDASCVYAPYHGIAQGLPFVQEFEFLPSPKRRDRLDELQIVCYPDDDGIGLLLQIDRQARGVAGLFAEATDTDEERFARLRFKREQLADGPGIVVSWIEEKVRKYA